MKAFTSKYNTQLRDVRLYPTSKESLKVHFANIFTLTLRVNNFKWNIKGLTFFSKRSLFDNIIRNLEKDAEATAERLRILDESVPATLRELRELSTIVDRMQPNSTNAMMKDLEACCIGVAEHCKQTIRIAELDDDIATADMLMRQLHLVEKAGWMFGSSTSERLDIPNKSDETVLIIERAHSKDNTYDNYNTDGEDSPNLDLLM